MAEGFIPDEKPYFSLDTTNVETPPDGKQHSGWLLGERPPARFMNWIHHFTWLWIQYLYNRLQMFIGFSPDDATQTIASGVLAFNTATANLQVEGEGGAADDLVTITETVLDVGRYLSIKPKTATHDITVKHGSGNIELAYGKDFVMKKITGGWDQLVLQKQADGKYYEVSRTMSRFVGALADTTLTIASGSITPTSANHTVETEAGAGTDDLANILTSNLYDGELLVVRCNNASHVVTVKHAAGGAGQIHLFNGVDLVLSTTASMILLKRIGTDWFEVSRPIPAVIAGGGGQFVFFNSTTTWTCPAGVYSVTIEEQGGGGGSGGAGSSGQNPGVGSGGGGGGSWNKYTRSVVPGTVYTITIGAAGVLGTGATSQTNGSAGGDTWFDTNAIKASGGGGSNCASNGGTHGTGAAALTVTSTFLSLAGQNGADQSGGTGGALGAGGSLAANSLLRQFGCSGDGGAGKTYTGATGVFGNNGVQGGMLINF